jgi:hypothetical protein
LASTLITGIREYFLIILIILKIRDTVTNKPSGGFAMIEPVVLTICSLKSKIEASPELPIMIAAAITIAHKGIR